MTLSRASSESTAHSFIVAMVWCAGWVLWFYLFEDLVGNSTSDSWLVIPLLECSDWCCVIRTSSCVAVTDILRKHKERVSNYNKWLQWTNTCLDSMSCALRETVCRFEGPHFVSKLLVAPMLTSHFCDISSEWMCRICLFMPEPNFEHMFHLNSRDDNREIWIQTFFVIWDLVLA